jgi:hypothetical protein
MRLSSQCALQWEVCQHTLQQEFAESLWSLVIATPWLQAMASLICYMVFEDGVN